MKIESWPCDRRQASASAGARPAAASPALRAWVASRGALLRAAPHPRGCALLASRTWRLRNTEPLRMGAPLLPAPQVTALGIVSIFDQILDGLPDGEREAGE